MESAGRRNRTQAPGYEPPPLQSLAIGPDEEEDESTSVDENKQYLIWAKRHSRAYKKLMPYMRKYKKAILACWEDGAHTFRLQRMPLQAQDIEYETTCGYPYCSSENGIMEPGTLRVSIERNEYPDSEVDWSRRIPLQPSQFFTPAWIYWPDGVQDKGKGKEVEHWLCLTCLEDLWMEGTGFDPATDNKFELTKMSDLSILQPETRKQGPNNKLYNLPSPHAYALAKWAAVIRYQDYIDPLHKADAAQCYEGEPGTLYEDLKTLKMRGIDEETGARVEISADQIRSPAIVQSGTRPIRFLSDILDWVDDEVRRVRQVAGISQTPRTIPKRIANASNRPRAKSNDAHFQINEAEDEPVALPTLPVTPRRQRRPALAGLNMTPSSKHRAGRNLDDVIVLSSSPVSISDNKENEAQETITPKSSEHIIDLSSSDEEPLANFYVARARRAANRARNEHLQSNVHQCAEQ